MSYLRRRHPTSERDAEDAVRNMSFDRLGKKDTLRHAIDIINQQVQEEVFAQWDESLLTEVRARVEALPDRMRRIIKAVFLERKKYREVADELGVSVNTVKTMLQKGPGSLRRHFNGRGDFFLLLLPLI